MTENKEVLELFNKLKATYEEITKLGPEIRKHIGNSWFHNSYEYFQIALKKLRELI